MRDLRSDGARQTDVLQDLRDRILRALRAHLVRSGEDYAVAEDCAQEALLIIQEKLETFRGESRFTTWATMIALRTLLGEIRRRRWKNVSIEQFRVGEELPAWPIDDAKSQDPEKAAQQSEAWRILKDAIQNDLTSRQRFVLVANVFQGMPLDLVADRLATNRDNVYKLIHDARKKLKKSLVEHGLSSEEILRIFEAR